MNMVCHFSLDLLCKAILFHRPLHAIGPSSMFPSMGTPHYIYCMAFSARLLRVSMLMTPCHLKSIHDACSSTKKYPPARVLASGDEYQSLVRIEERLFLPGCHSFPLDLRALGLRPLEHLLFLLADRCFAPWGVLAQF